MWPGLPLHWQREAQTQHLAVGTEHPSSVQGGPLGPGEYLTQGRLAPFLMQGTIPVSAPTQPIARRAKGQLSPRGSQGRGRSWRNSCRPSLSVPPPFLPPAPAPPSWTPLTPSTLTFLLPSSPPCNDGPFQPPCHRDSAFPAPASAHHPPLPWCPVIPAVPATLT